MEAHTPALVSVIVRTKDRPVLLMQALRSIRDQVYRPLELVLVNDGGCDLDLAEIRGMLGDVSLKYVRLEKNTGRAHAGNAGIEHSSGTHICFLDDDDVIYPGHISVLLNSPGPAGVDIAYTDAYYANVDIGQGLTGVVVKDKRIFSSTDFSFVRLLEDNFIPLMTLLFPADKLRACGGFDERFELYEDWDMLIRLAETSPFYHIPEATAEYRQWSDTEQIAQTEAFKEKAAVAHDQVTARHAKLYRSEMVRGAGLKEKELEEKRNEIGILQARLHELRGKEEMLNRIYSSRGWNLLLRYYKVRDHVFPPASRRRELAGKIFGMGRDRHGRIEDQKK